MYRLLVLYLILLYSCTTPNRIISYPVQTKPVYTIDPAPQKIILFNTYNIFPKKFRDNKEELFISFTDSLMDWAANRIQNKTGIATQVLKGYTPANSNTDSTAHALIVKHQATHAIIVEFLDVFFNQTNVEVTRDYNNKKERTAYYDIVCDIQYSFYAADSLLKEKKLGNRRFHSTRSVISGLLATGPNVVVQRKDAWDMVMDNGQLYLNYYFPGEARRSRPLFTGKGFETIQSAVAKEDYEAALIESMRMIKEPDKEKAAKALYNCAVLFERKNQPEEALSYVQQSLSVYELKEARFLRNDLEP